MDLSGVDKKSKNTGYSLKTEWRICHILFLDSQQHFLIQQRYGTYG